MNNSSNIALSLRNVSVRFRCRKRTHAFWALRDISCDLMYGETFGVIGRNGVGKSTMLRIIAGILAPDNGEVVNNAGQATLFSLQVGFVSHLTGRENALLSAMLLGMRKRDAKARLNSIIAYSGIGDLIDEPVGSYSTGMQARLGFSVAFHLDPPILLIDEIFAVGDAEFKQHSTKAMKERIRSERTVVIVSHNMDLICELCDRVLWIEQGRVMGLGETKSIVADYEKTIS